MKAKIKPFLRAFTAFACAAVLTVSPVLVSAEDSVSDLEQQTQDLQSELQSLNEQLSSLSKEITTLAKKIESTNKAAEQAELDLAAARLDEELQYQSMKKRIQYIYENGNTSVFDILFSSSSMADFLNRMEFVSNVTEYDRKMLQRLKKLSQDIDQKEKNLKHQQEQLDAMQKKMASKQEELNSKIASTNGKLASSSQALAQAKAAQEAAKKALQAKTDAYNAAGTNTSKKEDGGQSKPSTPQKPSKPDNSNENQKPESGNGNQNGGSNNSGNNNSGSGNNDTIQKPSQPGNTSDLVLLAAILECEAGSTNYDALLAVATVIMNRVESPRYPNTVHGVIYQRGQFSPTWNGSLSRVLERGPRPLCYQVARDTLNGKRLASVSGCYQFRAASTGHSGVVIGGNVFF